MSALSESRPERLARRPALRSLLVTMAISTTIALLIAVMEQYDAPLFPLRTLLISNVVGVCIWGGARLLWRASGGRVSPVTSTWLLAVPGVLAGMSVGDQLGGGRFTDWLWNPLQEWRALTGSLLLTFAAIAFAVRDRAATEYRAGLEVQRRQAAEARQGEALARLALLQAQIEPHFLFNTLANVQSMIERDPRTAARMLDHLNRYLRSSLGRTREAASTCAGEMELIGALLAIAEIRLGARLRHRMELPEALRQARLPPLLLQPLVENALKHGIEPAVDGGEVEVLCGTRAGALVLTVRDTGLGFREEAPAGVGLSNVRARLASLYGAAGHLALCRNEPRGTIAEITIPLEPAASQGRTQARAHG